MANTYVTETLSGATFYDATTGATTTLSGTWLAEYDVNGNLVSVYDPSFGITTAAGVTTTWSAASASGASPYLVHPTGSSNTSAYTKLYIDYKGETPTTLLGGTTAGTTAGSSTSVYNVATGNTDFLQTTGTITSAADTAVTTTIKGAVFADGSTLTGTWTAIYDASGTLQAVENATFVVTSTSGTTNTFTVGGTLPYANNTGDTSYEIHFGTVTGSGAFTSLYVDWKSENPSSFYEGSPSLYTSVVNNGSNPIRLVSDGTSGTGSVPVISNMPASLSGTDTATLKPLSAVTITDPDTTTTTSATVELDSNGVASDANGTLSGTGLTKIGTGTYTLAATTPAILTSELNALTFTPTVGEGASGSTFKTTIALAINDSDGSTSASTVLTETATCFLPGTLIDTPSGPAAIETLRRGDVVTVVENGCRVARAIVWAGRGHMDTARAADRAAAFPVRIRRDAFAAGVPARDLLVTSEHCLHLDGRLVPARMLVNGATIIVDTSITRYDYFHVELERHAILLAEGLQAESYLDTGNRGNFDGAVQALRPRFAVEAGHARWQRDAAAPLCVDRGFVEPIWTSLAARARALGFTTSDVSDLVSEPELRLVTSDGTAIAPMLCDGRVYAFVVPRGATGVRLVSRRFRPSETVGPFLDDRRALGVRVGPIGIGTGRDRRPSTSHLTETGLVGWHAAEGEAAGRWTTGNAVLPVDAGAGPVFLDIEVLDAGPYLARRAA